MTADRRILFSLCVVVSVFTLSAQKAITKTSSSPRLVIGIVVDQMRNDFLYRYWDRYGSGGFRRLVTEGFHFKNAHYNYIPTYTGPGHCSIYTGATPRAHGVIANDWCRRGADGYMYCVEDTSVRTIGAEGKAGWMSPKNQLSSTIGDELKMNTVQRAKVFSVSLKDRSAVLPGGHTADAAFWFDDASGNFISSSWYLKQLPAWLQEFNQKGLVSSYLSGGWQTLYPLTSYTASVADDNNYEEAPNKKEKAVFPYDYKKQIEEKKYGIIKYSPWGNALTKDLAIACLRNEQLGKDKIPDLLCISFSTPDLVGHAYGPRSVETEDVYLRLDKDLEELLNELDRQVGKGNYTVFLTADHGGADVPAHLAEQRIPTGRINDKRIVRELKQHLQSQWGDSLLFQSFSNEQVFLYEAKLNKLKLDRNKVEHDLATFLITLPGVAEAYPSDVLLYGAFPERDFRTLLQNGYNHRLSGNVSVLYAPGWMDHGSKGTTHGSGYNYDTHVPVIFYGNGVKPGNTWDYTTISQIAPTVCELLHISQPSATTSEPLNNYLR